MSETKEEIVQLDPSELEGHYKRAWEFYTKIGSPKLVVAPMVNQSELAFRMLCRKYKAELCYTPMFHSRLFAQKYDHCDKSFATCEEDRPLFVQFCANDPRFLLQAAQLVETRCDAVDINLGCPQGIARRGHYGSFLLEEWGLLTRMVKNLYDNLSVPVTCKIRILPTVERTLELARILQDAGCSVLCVHGRTKEMLKQAIGPSDFEIIAKIKEQLKIPVIANGGIETMKDVTECIEETKVDGVMSSEAVLEDPLLFVGGVKDTNDNLKIAEEYLEFAKKYNIPGHDSCIRPHMFKLIFRSLSVHTDLRNSMHGMKNDEIIEVIQAIREREKNWTPEQHEQAYGKIPTWYRRHPHKGSPEEEELRKKKQRDYDLALAQTEEEEPPLFDLFGDE